MMKVVVAITTLAIVVLSVGGAQAMSGRGTVCVDNRNAAQAAKCLRAAMISAEKALDEKLRSVSGWLHNTPPESELARSQDIWQRDVGQTCDGLIKSAAATEPSGDVDVLSCQVELTLERTRHLDRMFYVPLHG
ncbi:MAG TPA: lysozyme inhibitor LprI family protein [Rhizomicrobium sp.]|jgi:uncharacterized protein YecT (DUF1311 family)